MPALRRATPQRWFPALNPCCGEIMPWTNFSEAAGLALARNAVKAGALAAGTSSALETALACKQNA